MQYSCVVLSTMMGHLKASEIVVRNSNNSLYPTLVTTVRAGSPMCTARSFVYYMYLISRLKKFLRQYSWSVSLNYVFWLISNNSYYTPPMNNVTLVPPITQPPSRCCKATTQQPRYGASVFQ